jgi:CRISPR-associated endonuclease/helicase Cas3
VNPQTATPKSGGETNEDDYGSIPPWASTQAPSIWGKWDNSGAYPLLAHLLDTAACAYAMWDISLSKQFRARLQTIATKGRRRTAFSVLAALHDCGKLEPMFQGQQAARWQSQPLSSNRKALENDGFEMLNDDHLCLIESDSLVRRNMRHEMGTGFMLADRGFPPWVSTVLSGHHGAYPEMSHYAEARGAAFDIRSEFNDDGSRWKTERSHLISAVRDAVTAGDSLEWSQTLDGALIPMLTGAVIQADWLASDESFRNAAPLSLVSMGPDGWRKYFLIQCKQARSHVKKHLGATPSLGGSFQDLFGFEPSRDVQHWAVNDVKRHHGLTVVTVPPGEGKTETALWMHAASDADDGLIFGLPTMATSDAMFSRVRKAFRGTRALANLAHGHAALNAFYSTSNLNPSGVCDDECSDGLEASLWFKGRHRALLAPVVVSTCDQILAASLSHKFSPVRLAALANKHIILDEVHTYDPYQDKLLTRLLGWLGFMGTRVTLLTATLPQKRLESYLHSYALGMDGGKLNQEWSSPEIFYPGVSWVRRKSRTSLDIGSKPLHSWREYRHNIVLQPVSGRSGRWPKINDTNYTNETAAVISGLSAQYPKARIGVIVNTVDRAIHIADKIRASEKDKGRETLLLHSRMTSNQRMTRTNRLLKELGPRSNGEGGEGHSITVVSTQIAEASLDVDFDILVTDICPMPSLLQRLGRQWRHSSVSGNVWDHSNPAVFDFREGKAPEAIVVYPTTKSGDLALSDSLPYTKAEIQKSFGALKNLSGISFPRDLQRLMDDTYITLDDITLDDPQSDEHLRKYLQAAFEKAGKASESGVEVGLALQGWANIESSAWQDPDSHAEVLDKLTTGRLWGDDVAQTRLTETMSLTILPYDLAASHQVAWHKDPQVLTLGNVSKDVQIDALSHCVAVSGSLAKKLSSIEPPTNWQESVQPIFRGVLPVEVSTLGNLGVTLDENGLFGT